MFILLGVGFGSVFVGLVMAAQGDGNGGLGPGMYSGSNAANGTAQNGVNVGGLPSTIANSQSPGELVKNIYQYALGIVGLAALGAIIYGGILWIFSAGIPGNQAKAQEWIKGALWGLLLLLGAAVLFNTINPYIVDTGAIDASLKQNLNQGQLPPASQAPPTSSTPTDSTWPPVSDAEARAMIGGDANINNPDCQKVGDQNCTSLRGMPNPTLNCIKQIASATQKVTGGTEWWLHGDGVSPDSTHHGPGKATADFRYSRTLPSQIDGYKQKGWVTFYQCENRRQKISCDGSQGTPDHVHVEFAPGTSCQ